jgi:hypothetical protein
MAARMYCGRSTSRQRFQTWFHHPVVIIRAGASRLAYEAHPSGQAPTVFLATTVTERSVVFENRQHDFPQQVAYERRGADSLLAWISGPMKGQTRRIEFPYVRVKCP